MKSIRLIFGCHSHQPIGNFENVFEMAFQQAYLPFVEVLEKYPDVRVTQHFTGPLLDWFEANQPGFLERLGVLAKTGQIEIMGGGYYEPLLCAIPEQDSIDQIRRMGDFCEKHFGQRPKGMWLTERVWEPHMPRILNKAGIEYTALDDMHFLCSGLTPEELFGYYVTEDEGLSVKVFPILEKLRYMVPFHRVEESIAYLKENATEDGLRCAVLHDDGEKFGVWPETHRSVYTEGWLEEFFQALTDNKDWLHSTTYSDYMAEVSAIGRAYLATASYHEMMEWVLPTSMHRRLKQFKKRLEPDTESAAEQKLFIRGGFWRGFLAKYAESNNIQKRMLYTSHRLSEMSAAATRPNSKKFEAARKLLHQGQCNCAYWHGVFGGLYLNHLRTAIYEKIIESDRTLDAIAHKDDKWVSCETLDFDADGYPEVLLSNSQLWLGVSPHDGGTLFEWDYKEKPFNFGNTLTRREEVYHDLLREGRVHVGEAGKGDLSIHEMVRAKETGLDEYLVYDPYRRVSLRDHFLPRGVPTRDLWKGTHHELGDFATGIYTFKAAKDKVTLSRNGHVWYNDAEHPFTVRKTISLKPRASSYEIRYDITYDGSASIRLLFGVEFAVNLLSGTSFDRYYRSDDRDMAYTKLGVMGCDEGLTHIALRDDWQQFECGLRFERACCVHRFAIETVSQSENGQERVYQGSIVIPCWTLSWEPGQTLSRKIQAEIVRTSHE